MIPDDVKAVTFPVLTHRLILSSEARIERKNMDDILTELLDRVFIPVMSND